MRSWRRRSSTGCCTIATSSTSGATATGCGSSSTGCGQRRTNSVRESHRDRRLRSVAARVGQDAGRSAPCVQPNTPDGHHRENVRSARDVLPRSVQFSVAKSVQFSVAIDRAGRRGRRTMSPDARDVPGGWYRKHDYTIRVGTLPPCAMPPLIGGWQWACRRPGATGDHLRWRWPGCQLCRHPVEQAFRPKAEPRDDFRPCHEAD